MRPTFNFFLEFTQFKMVTFNTACYVFFNLITMASQKDYSHIYKDIYKEICIVCIGLGFRILSSLFSWLG